MVEWKKLGEVCTFKRGQVITSKTAVEGDIPVIAGGQTPSYYHNEFNRDGESITVAGSGAYAGYICYWNQPIFVSDAFTVDPIDTLKHRYLFYWLKLNQGNVYAAQKGAGVPHVHGKDIANFQIPIPSLQEQTRIVTILDTFTSAIDNLKDQIAFRRKQYEYYRNQLLAPEGKEDKDIKCWGDFCKITRGNGVQKANFEEKGKGCIHYGQIYTYYGSYTHTTNKKISIEIYDKAIKASTGDLIMTDTSENVEDICKTVAYLGKDDIAVSNHTFVIKHKQNPKFLSFSTQTKGFLNQKRQFVVGAKVSCIKQTLLEQIKIYLPSLQEQHRIVAILDTFETSIANLEAQLKEREKQYEYYRNKLLTFE